jgi:PqqD family protein of HPr-rel-A system
MLIQIWGDKAVVYHPESGNTHLLNSEYASILELMQSSIDRETLAMQLVNENVTDSIEMSYTVIDTAITSFKHLELL